MKKILFTLFLFLMFPFWGICQKENYSENQILGVHFHNKIPPRTSVIPCYDEEQIFKRNYKESISTLWLDEAWHFKFFENKTDSFGVYLSSKFDDKLWEEESFPSQWELKYKKKLEYKTEVKQLTLDSADSYPKGLYRKKLVIPSDWANKQVILHIGSANAGVKVWINEQLVGYNFLTAQVSSEFDITSFAKAGKEIFMAIEIQSQSKGSSLDISNNIAIHGIMGDVYLYAKPDINIHDYKVVAELDENFKNGLLKVNVVVENSLQKSENFFVELELKDEKGEQMLKAFKYMKVGKKDPFLTLDFSETVTTPKHWNAETPNLYTLILRIKDSKQNEIELLGERIGFKKTEVKNGIFLINGVPVKLKGVNYIDYHSQKGFAMQQKDFLNDIRLMKSNNINAVRTMGQPVSEEFYKLCTEHGLYVFDEANLGIFPEKSDLTETQTILLAQLQSMYERDKNNTCIVAWSLGSSTQNSKHYEIGYKWLKDESPSIPVQSIAAETSWNTDIYAGVCPDLSAISSFAARPQKLPLICAKYLTRYGNSLGGLKVYWDAFNLSPQTQGGFLSCWIDQSQAIANKQNDSLVSWTFPQKEIKSATTFYGLLQADRTPHPELQEVKAVFANFDIHAVNIAEGEFEVTNQYDFLNLKNFELNYKIFSNLKESVSEGIITLDVAPKKKKVFGVSIPKMKAYANEEYFIVFTLQQKERGKIVPQAYPLGIVTFPIKMDNAKQTAMPTSELYKISQKEEPNKWTLFNDDLEITFDKKAGEIVSFQYKGKPLFVQMPKLNFWRPPTQNDELDENALQMWKNYGLKETSKIIKSTSFKIVDENTCQIIVTAEILNSQNAQIYNLAQTYTFYGNGDVFIENQLRPVANMVSIPKIGMQLQMAKNFTMAQWFGFENETYKDRKMSGQIGVYELPLSKITHRYAKPQASGNRMETRWVSFTSPDSVGLFIGASSVFQFSVYPFSDSDIEESVLDENLQEQNFWTVNIDKEFSPVGSTYCGESILEKELVASNNLTFAIHLRPFEAKNQNPDDFRLSKFNYSSEEILEAPLIISDRKRFDTTMYIVLETGSASAEIRYTLNGKDPEENDFLYTKPFPISNTCVVKAKVFKKGLMPSFSTSRTFQFNYVKDIVFESTPNTPYNKDLKTILFDNVRGKTTNFEKNWLGFSGKDFSVIIEMVKPVNIKNISVGFGHMPETWVFLPDKMTVETSADNITFSAPQAVKIPFDPMQEKTEKPLPIDLSVEVNQDHVRFVRIKATNIGLLPSWHPVKGLRAWIMVDEVVLEEKL